jgi:DNA end-binding protein Ku
MKAIWKGYLKCSLVTIPVKLYTATTKRGLQFHLYHEKCGSQIRQENICPVCRQTLTNDEIVKGYQYGKDVHVVLTDADFEKARKESTDTIEVMKFVEEHQINPIYYTDSYYLAPDGKVGAEAFAVLHRAMQETGRTAVAKVVMRNREYLYNIRPYHGVFIAFTLHYPDEIRRADEIDEAAALENIPVSTDNLGMAKTLIAHLSADFIPEQYRDGYTQTLLQIIRAKAEGKEIKVEPRVEREKVINLMEALKRSVAETGKAPKKAMARAGRRVPQKPRERQQA